MFLDALLDSLLDSLKLLPFLLLTYLLMEYLEHKASKKTEELVVKSGFFGPLWGSLLGVVPQCGFSAAASNLYAGRVITLGTLISIYLSTSDEMLPIMISEKAPAAMIFKILGLKVLIGMILGFLVDLAVRLIKGPIRIEYRKEHLIEQICDHDHCNCDDGHIFKSACMHTLQVFAFIFVISLVLNLVIGVVGEETIASFMAGKDILSVFLSALIGLIPNCASSVVITQLYMEGILSFGAMMAGLLVGAGVGLLVLFRVNEKITGSLKITGLLYILGVISGIILSVIAF